MIVRMRPAKNQTGRRRKASIRSLLLSHAQLYSPSGNENQVATFLESELRKKGLSTRRDVVGNVIGEWDGEASNTPLRTHGHGPRKTTVK